MTITVQTKANWNVGNRIPFQIVKDGAVFATLIDRVTKEECRKLSDWYRFNFGTKDSGTAEFPNEPFAGFRSRFNI